MIATEVNLQGNFVEGRIEEILGEIFQEIAGKGETGREETGGGDDRSREDDKENVRDRENRDWEGKETRQRSGSVPSHKITKESDIQSISTMTGTFPSHKSDKRIEDIDPRRSTLHDPIKDPEQVMKKKQPLTWVLDRNGYMFSASQDITTIKYYFIKVATKLGMSVMRDLENLIMVKTQRIESFKCLFLMCLPLMTMADRCVYQLERYKDKSGGSRIRLVLISGVETKFQQFRKEFYYELWDKGVLKLSNFEALTLLVFVNRNIIAEISQDYEQAYAQYQIRNLSSEQELELWQNRLIRKFKLSEQKIKQKIFSQANTQVPASNSPSHSLYRNPINQILLQRILLHEVPVCPLYLKMEMQGNRQLQEKKKQILTRYTVRRIFEYLEIDLKLLKEQFWTNTRAVCEIGAEGLPYAEAVVFLDQLNLELSPLENIRKIANFRDKLLECFQSSIGKGDSMMDMDNQLPLTIYCTLISKNTQLKPIIAFLRDYFQPEDDFESENRTIAALKAALEYARQEWVVQSEGGALE